ncbi:MAG: hypothetical protein ACK4RK_19605 [Gemmataceae bacterium]
MNIQEPQSGSTFRGESEPADLDGALRTFFRSEMPDPWPAAPRTVAPLLRLRQPRRRRTLVLSRVALAASLALLFLGQWLLSSNFPIAPSSATLDLREDEGTASRVFPPVVRVTPDGRKVSIDAHQLPEKDQPVGVPHKTDNDGH